MPSVSLPNSARSLVGRIERIAAMIEAAAATKPRGMRVSIFIGGGAAGLLATAQQKQTNSPVSIFFSFFVTLFRKVSQSLCL